MSQESTAANSAVPGNADFGIFSTANHPIACFFHVFFKGAAVFSYLFMSMFLDEVLVFMLVILMSAFDFWTVKNITGRKLVSLRWWAEI